MVDRKVPFLVLAVSVQGETLASCARFKFMFEIAVHNDSEWTTVKLLHESAAITQSSIKHHGRDKSESSTGLCCGCAPLM